MYEKDGISIYYSDIDIAFEEVETGRAIIFSNEGYIKFNTFNKIETEYFKEYFNKVYSKVEGLRKLEKEGLI